MHRIRQTAILVIACLFAASCTVTTSGDRTAADNASTTAAASVPALPPTAHPSCSADATTRSVPSRFDGNGFDRYYELVVDDQIAMQYVFQPSLTQAQIEHVVRTTRWYLTNVVGSTYGADKSAVVKTLAANQATIVVPDGSHVEGQDLGVRGQELYANEIAAPGSAWYVNNNEEHRDATYEEVFHQVHDAGIGTNEPGALPDYQSELLAEAEIAKADGRWASDSPDWIADLTQEGSLAQEYIASVIDNYYGLWAHSGDGSGYYAYNTRAGVLSGDPVGAALLKQFLGDTVEIEAFIDPDFDGTFHLNRTDAVAYSSKSQYLRGARLTGMHPSGIVGNALDNTLRGNRADNTLDGAAGTDTAIYCGPSSDYTIETTEGITTVSGPDGTDTLIAIEALHFTDGVQKIS